MATKKNSGNLKPRTIRIRMYRVGFGDCFLLSLPSGNSHKHFVIDCGVHGSGNIKTIGLAVENIRTETGGKVAAVIATHSHQDHISGFSEAWETMNVEEVWLPWSEDPTDELALKWSKKQAKLAEDLVRHFAAQAALGAAVASTPDRLKAVNAVINLVGNDDALGLLGAAGSSNAGKLTTNAKAMKRLKEGLKGAKVRYLDAGKGMANPFGITGLEIKVLGPPRLERFLKDMDPPASEEFERLAASGTESESVNKIRPFPPHWIRDEKIKGFVSPLDKKKRTQLKESLLDTSLNALAFALDSFKNNTSLVTLFIFRGEYLLFSGDAQHGNWLSWLEEKGAEETLSKVSFYKVGHHGSHNATPRIALEKMSGAPAAMVSTQSEPWDVIPRNSLMQMLNEKTAGRIVRSDWLKQDGAIDPLPGSVPAKPRRNPKGFSAGSDPAKTLLWYDYEVAV